MREHELKIPVADLDRVRERLVVAGARCVRPAAREVNLLLDWADQRLKASDQALRLRQVAGAASLTFKGPSQYRGAVKEREEVELDLSDPESMTTILERLGLRPLFRYEKDRELWRLGEVEVALDHTPMGDFVELEGLPTGLESAAVCLELDPRQALSGSYPSLWQRFREEHAESDLPTDMLFAP